MAEEPAENISGGVDGGGAPAAFEPASADTRAERVVDVLGEMYWQKAYGGRDALECLVRTILSQNTSDVASQPAHDALMARYGPDGQTEGAHDSIEDSPESDTDGSTESNDDDTDTDLLSALADAEQSTLAETISGAGLYNQKSETIIDAAGELREQFGTAAGFDEFVKNEPADTVRERLLEIRGVGPKTADCVLLFAGGRGGVFPVDTHVHRIARRLGLAPPDADHEGVREPLEADVPPEKCGFGHTAMIQFGREYCTARSPACLDGPEACPLYDECDRVGVDEVSESVVDPAEVDPAA